MRLNTLGSRNLKSKKRLGRGIGSSKVLPIKPDNSRINEYLDRPRLID